MTSALSKTLVDREGRIRPRPRRCRCGGSVVSQRELVSHSALVTHAAAALAAQRAPKWRRLSPRTTARAAREPGASSDGPSGSARDRPEAAPRGRACASDTRRTSCAEHSVSHEPRRGGNERFARRSETQTDGVRRLPLGMSSSRRAMSRYDLSLSRYALSVSCSFRGARRSRRGANRPLPKSEPSAPRGECLRAPWLSPPRCCSWSPDRAGPRSRSRCSSARRSAPVRPRSWPLPRRRR